MNQKEKIYYNELAEKIESGEYFVEAREWYLKKYIFNFIERSYLLAGLGAFILLMLLSYSYYQSLLPIKKSLPVKVKISSTADFAAKITYLGNKEKDFDINRLYIKYFSGRFVDAIESYDHRNGFKKIKRNRNMIESLATPEILSYYIDKVSIRNPDSITMKYRNKITRRIEVDATKSELAEIPLVATAIPETSKNDRYTEIKNYQATVNFSATEIDNETGKSSISYWQSKIILSFQTIKYNYTEKDFTPFNFKVSNYESKRIN